MRCKYVKTIYHNKDNGYLMPAVYKIRRNSKTPLLQVLVQKGASLQNIHF